MKLVAVTACAAGVAHTYMAAEGLEKAAKERNHEIKVETQGTLGIDNRITAEDLEEVAAVILTKDIPIRERERFEGFKIFNVTSTACIMNAPKVIEAVENNCK